MPADRAPAKRDRGTGAPGVNGRGIGAPGVIKMRALAKINLSLHIVGVRPDGYHELRTILQSIALHDTLTIRVRRGPLELQCDEPACPTGPTNLVWRAAERVWAASKRRGKPRDVAIHLAKRIPLQACLGGGSSDAAATLRALGSLWDVDQARLGEIARSLGADVPYFFEGGTVLGLERGDLLFPLLDSRAAWVVLVIPDFGVSTEEAYGWWDRSVGRALSDPPVDLQNDLQAPVAVHHPEITRIVRALTRAGGSYAAMSGSGSAVFGLFDCRPAADRAVGVLGRRGWRTMLSRTVSRTAYQRLARISHSPDRF